MRFGVWASLFSRCTCIKRRRADFVTQTDGALNRPASRIGAPADPQRFRLWPVLFEIFSAHVVRVSEPTTKYQRGVIMSSSKQTFPRLIRYGAALTVGALGMAMASLPSAGQAATKKTTAKTSAKKPIAKPIPLTATTTPPTIPAPVALATTVPAPSAAPPASAPTTPTTTIRKIDQNPDFDITLLYPRPFIRLGQTASVGGEIVFRSTAQPVDLSLANAPAGLNMKVTPNPTTGKFEISLQASPNTALGDYPMSLIATSGQVTKAAGFTVTVANSVASTPAGAATSGPPFSVIVTGTNKALVNGGAVGWTVAVVPGPGYSGSVDLSMADVPQNVWVGFSASRIATSGEIYASSTLPLTAGTYTMRLEARVGNTVVTIPMTLVLQ